MESFRRDLRYGVRALAKNRSFAIVAVLTLGLGIGASTAVFIVINAVFLQPLPYDDPDRLVVVWEDASYIGYPRNTPSPGNFLDWKANNSSFEEMAAMRPRDCSLTRDGEPERLSALAVTASLFPLFGVRMALGARPRDVVALVVGRGMRLVAIGSAAGLVLSFALTRLMSSLLFGVSASDPLTLAIVPVLLATVALVASYVPARRAASVDPNVALRGFELCLLSLPCGPQFGALALERLTTLARHVVERAPLRLVLVDEHVEGVGGDSDVAQLGQAAGLDLDRPADLVELRGLGEELVGQAADAVAEVELQIGEPLDDTLNGIGRGGFECLLVPAPSGRLLFGGDPRPGGCSGVEQQTEGLQELLPAVGSLAFLGSHNASFGERREFGRDYSAFERLHGFRR